MYDIENNVENTEVEAVANEEAAKEEVNEVAESQPVEAPVEEPATEEPKKAKKGRVHPVVAWVCIGLAAAIVLFVGLFIAKTLV